MYASETFSDTLGFGRQPPMSDSQANNVRLECSAPLSNECPLLMKLCSSPVFSRAELPARERSLHLVGVQKCSHCQLFYKMFGK